MADTKISALTAITAPQDPAKMYVPLYAQDGTPLNARMNFTEMFKTPAAATFTGAANASIITATGYSLTGSNAQSLIDVSGTWNTTGTPTLIKANVTDTASNAASKLLDLQVGGTPRFSVQKDAVTHINGTSVGGTGEVLKLTSSYGTASLRVGGGGTFNIGGTLKSEGDIIASNNNSVIGLGTITDVHIARDAADRLALRRSTNAQRFAVYRTWSAADNFERGVMSWYDSSTNDGVAGTVLRIGTEKGTVGGTARNVSFVTDGVERMNIDTAGNIQCLTSGTNFTGQWVNANQNLRVLNNSGAVLLGASSDVGMTRPAASILGITNGSTGGGAIEFTEMTAPATPAANQARVFARDNGSGKTQVCIILPDGVVTVLATET